MCQNNHIFVLYLELNRKMYQRFPKNAIRNNQNRNYTAFLGVNVSSSVLKCLSKMSRREPPDNNPFLRLKTKLKQKTSPRTQRVVKVLNGAYIATNVEGKCL